METAKKKDLKNVTTETKGEAMDARFACSNVALNAQSLEDHVLKIPVETISSTDLKPVTMETTETEILVLTIASNNLEAVNVKCY